MQAVTVPIREVLPEVKPGVKLCDDCSRIATKLVKGEEFGALAGYDLWLCDCCARSELARRMKYPPRGECGVCKRLSALLPLWVRYSRFVAGLPDSFLCRDCKYAGQRMKHVIEEVRRRTEEARQVEVLDKKRHTFRFIYRANLMRDDDECAS